MPVHPIEAISAAEWLASLAERGGALLYKHSPYCGISLRAAHELESFAESHPEIPIYRVDVIYQRELSQELARLLDVHHASPQIIFLENRVPVAQASHYDISVLHLERMAGVEPSGNGGRGVALGEEW